MRLGVPYDKFEILFYLFEKGMKESQIRATIEHIEKGLQKEKILLFLNLNEYGIPENKLSLAFDIFNKLLDQGVSENKKNFVRFVKLIRAGLKE